MQVDNLVDLLGSNLPKVVVGKGYIINTNPTQIVGGVPLGQNYWEVNVTEVFKPYHLLPKHTKHIQTIGDALGKNIAWLSHDVSNFYLYFLL